MKAGASGRAAVVAYGAVSALGEGAAAVDPGVVGAPARSGIRRDDELAAVGLVRPFAARAASAVTVARGDRATELLLRAFRGCIAELDGALPSWRSRRVGLALGTSSGGMRAFEAAHGKDASVLATSSIYLAPAIEADLATVAGVDALAPFSLVLGACASSTLAIGLARSWLLADRCDVVLAGGFDAVSIFVASGFEALRATAGERGPRPFRRDREGLALGEGAAVAALVREHVAAGAGARVHGFVAGFGASCDAAHLTAPDRTGAGLARAGLAALRDATASEVGLVSAHGTATEANDRSEALAIDAVARNAVVHAFKGSIGHTLGAAGALESLSALVALERGLAPASAGDGPVVEGAAVLDVARPSDTASALKLSAAFGGANGALVLDAARVTRSSPPPSSRDVFVSRAVAVRRDELDARTSTDALAAATGQPEDRIARADGLVRVTLAAVAALGAPRGAGVVVGEGRATHGTNVVYLERIRAAGAVRAEPRRFPFTTPNAAAGEAAVAFGLEGPAFAVGGGAHGGLEALAVAADLVRGGHAERMVVVAADEGEGAVALLVSSAREGAVARLESASVALCRAPGAASAPRPDLTAHRALLALTTGRPEALEVENAWGIIAKVRFFWL